MNIHSLLSFNAGASSKQTGCRFDLNTTTSTTNIHGMGLPQTLLPIHEILWESFFDGFAFPQDYFISTFKEYLLTTERYIKGRVY